MSSERDLSATSRPHLLPLVVPATSAHAARAAVLSFQGGRPPADDFVQDPSRGWRMDA